MTYHANPQQGGKKGKEKAKDVMALMENRLAKLKPSMSTLMGRTEAMEKHIEELESMVDMKELCGEMQGEINSVVVNASKEIKFLRASEAIKDAKP